MKSLNELSVVNCDNLYDPPKTTNPKPRNNVTKQIVRQRERSHVLDIVGHKTLTIGLLLRVPSTVPPGNNRKKKQKVQSSKDP